MAAGVIGRSLRRSFPGFCALAFASFSLSAPALAQGATAASGADTAWMLMSTVLVMLMVLPGILLLNAGSKSADELFASGVLIFTATAVTTVVWAVFGYSLAFSNGGELNFLIGSLDNIFLTNISKAEYIGSIPVLLYALFQLSFAIITVALLCGAFDRSVNLVVFFGFVVLWVALVYVPVAHCIWGGGALSELKFLDFAGGTVVHLSSGVSGAVLIARRGRMPKGKPHSIDNLQTLCMFGGASFLWLGWFGFNGGSALAANENATLAFATTQFAAATAALVWFFNDNLFYGYLRPPSLLAGALAGLVAVTPASGYVSVSAAMLIGAIAGGLCFFASWFVRDVLRWDDRTDLISVHAVGGAIGTLLTGVFATKFAGTGEGWIDGNPGQLGLQAVAVVIVAVWCVIVTWLLISLLEALFQRQPRRDRVSPVRLPPAPEGRSHLA
jgi:Amt family ammonium transporter